MGETRCDMGRQGRDQGSLWRPRGGPARRVPPPLPAGSEMAAGGGFALQTERGATPALLSPPDRPQQRSASSAIPSRIIPPILSHTILSRPAPFCLSHHALTHPIRALSSSYSVHPDPILSHPVPSPSMLYVHSCPIQSHPIPPTSCPITSHSIHVSSSSIPFHSIHPVPLYPTVSHPILSHPISPVPSPASPCLHGAAPFHRAAPEHGGIHPGSLSRWGIHWGHSEPGGIPWGPSECGGILWSLRAWGIPWGPSLHLPRYTARVRIPEGLWHSPGSVNPKCHIPMVALTYGLPCPTPTSAPSSEQPLGLAGARGGLWWEGGTVSMSWALAGKSQGSLG